MWRLAARQVKPQQKVIQLVISNWTGFTMPKRLILCKTDLSNMTLFLNSQVLVLLPGLFCTLKINVKINQLLYFI